VVNGINDLATDDNSIALTSTTNDFCLLLTSNCCAAVVMRSCRKRSKTHLRRFASAVVQIHTVNICHDRAWKATIAGAAARAGRVACFDVSVAKKKSLSPQRQRAQQMLEFNTYYRILNVCNLSSQNPYSFHSRHSQWHTAANVNLTDAKCRGDPVNSLH
jgi:hypothetical protein